MRKDFEAKYGALDSKFKEISEAYIDVEDRLAGTLISAEISKHISSVGSVRKGAMDDILNRAQRTFSYKEGSIVALDADGSPVYSKDGKTPMSVAEWCSGLAEAAPYFFEGNNGGGAQGNNGGQGGSKAIAKGDNNSFISNLDSIAKGTTVISDRG